MRKFFLGTLSAMVVFAMTSALHADHHDPMVESWFNRVYIGGKGLAVIPFEDGLEVSGYGGGMLGYWWNEWLATELEVGFTSLENEAETFEVDVVPLLVSLRADLPIELGWPLHPYLFGGIGVFFNDTDTAGLEIDDSFAGQVGAGLEYDFNENFTAYLELKFFFSQPDVEAGSAIVGDEELDLNAFLVGGGIAIHF